MSGTPKTEKTEISDFQKICIPVIRKILPTLVAQDILGVQPMGLGPPVCTNCMVIGTLDDKHETHPWSCRVCGDTKVAGSLWTYTKDLQTIIEARTRTFDRAIMDTPFKIMKRFMFPNDPLEPNDRYRPWLEKNVGKQSVDWEWQIVHNNLDMLEVCFKEHSHACLFELTFE